jgi:hypothetical protein
MLKVYDRIGALVHQLMRHIKLLTNVVPRMLGLTEAMVCDIQLLVLV